MWAAAPLAVVAVYSAAATNLVMARYLIVVLPALLLLCAAGLDRLLRWRLPGAVALGLLAALTAQAISLQATMPCPSLRELTVDLRARWRPGDGLLLTPHQLIRPFAFHWDEQVPAWLRRHRGALGAAPGDTWWLATDAASDVPLRRQPRFRRWLDHRPRVWVVTIRDWPGDRRSPPMMDLLEGRLRRGGTRHYHYSGADLILFERRRNAARDATRVARVTASASRAPSSSPPP